MSRLEAPGTRHRNHCPYCLSSLHVDIRKGDRRSGCRGRMEAIAIWVKESGEWALIHRCTRCGTLNANRIAGDDDETALRALLGPARDPGTDSPRLRATSSMGAGDR